MAEQDHATDDAPAAVSKRADRAQAAGPGDASGAATAQSVLINRQPQEVYDRFRDFAQLPTFMENVERIDVTDPTRSHWIVKAPGGSTVEWDAIVTEDRPGELIAWTSDEGADVANSGRIEFKAAPGGRGTYVTAQIVYDPPVGAIGKLVAKLFQREPAIQARRDLRRFKQLIETGEIATNAMNPAQQREKESA